MSIFKSRKAAIAVFVIVVIVFSLLGSHLSLSRHCRRIESEFFADTVASPGTQLDECVKYANRILSVIQGTLDESLYDALYDSRIALNDALEAEDISAIGEANGALTAAVTAVDNASAGVSYDTTEDFDLLLSNFYGAQRVAADSDYNQTVDDFTENVLGVFPTNILWRLTRVQTPERFE